MEPLLRKQNGGGDGGGDGGPTGSNPCQRILREIHELEYDLGLAQEAGDTQQEAVLKKELAKLQLKLQACLAPQLLGIEATQAIQYFNASGQGSGFAADNSVPLVANKATILRVYVQPLPRSPLFVTASLAYNSITYGWNSLIFEPLSDFGTPRVPLSYVLRVVALPMAGYKRGDSPSNRANLAQTLSFAMPAADCVGELDLTVTLKSFILSNGRDPLDYSETNYDFRVAFEEVPDPVVHGVLIHYTGVDYFDKPVDAQPTGLDFVYALDFLHKTYPISGLFYDGCEVLPWSDKVSVVENFYNLKSRLDMMRAMSRSSDLYVGLLPPEAGSGGISGLGGNMAALAYSDDGPGVAHECGHALGRLHTQCHNQAGSPDPGYPIYDGFPQGSIGEYGLDRLTGTLFDPHSSFDFMSYCEPRWVSPYTYVALKDAISRQWSTVASPIMSEASLRVSAEASAEYLHLFLRVHFGESRKHVEVLSAFHLPGSPPSSVTDSNSDMILQLRSAGEKLIGSYRCTASVLHQEPGVPFTDFVGVVPWTSDLKAIHVLQGEKVLATLEPAGQGPHVEITQFEHHAQRRDLLRVAWRGEAEDQDASPLHYGLRYSHNGGDSWRTILAGTTETKHVINLDLLPGGEACRLQVVASAGLRTSVTETDRFEVNINKPRRPHFVSPEAGAVFHAGEPIVLAGGGFSPDFGSTPFEEVVWTSHIAGYIGTGFRVITDSLPVGYHRLTLHIPDGLGGEVCEGRYVHVKPRERHAYDG